MDEKKHFISSKNYHNSINIFFFVIFIYYFVVNFSSIYSNFEEVKFLIYLSIFILSIVQIFVKFLSVFISAQEKFDILEKSISIF